MFAMETMNQEAVGFYGMTIGTALLRAQNVLVLFSFVESSPPPIVVLYRRESDARYSYNVS